MGTTHASRKERLPGRVEHRKTSDWNSLVRWPLPGHAEMRRWRRESNVLDRNGHDGAGRHDDEHQAARDGLCRHGDRTFSDSEPARSRDGTGVAPWQLVRRSIFCEGTRVDVVQRVRDDAEVADRRQVAPQVSEMYLVR